MSDATSRLGDFLNDRGQSPFSTISIGTVSNVNSSSVDISLNGGTLIGIPFTSACYGVKENDRVLVEKFGHLCIATGIIVVNP